MRLGNAASMAPRSVFGVPWWDCSLGAVLPPLTASYSACQRAICHRRHCTNGIGSSCTSAELIEVLPVRRAGEALPLYPV